ncbi:hypothetical protein EVG20_g938 [Dentipellis fragilis]|uniref:C2 domain-containing protein n=1 Tax=Dentipellis fragilis TaxID=205917 RepID=A0A4Y9ZE99_9AGAM|nr:hypothetical protein EVG20_g938 [Dentipellis fragilis]
MDVWSFTKGPLTTHKYIWFRFVGRGDAEGSEGQYFALVEYYPPKTIDAPERPSQPPSRQNSVSNFLSAADSNSSTDSDKGEYRSSGSSKRSHTSTHHNQHLRLFSLLPASLNPVIAPSQLLAEQKPDRGAEVAELRGVQLNEAMFVGGLSWMPKLAQFLLGSENGSNAGASPPKKTKLTCEDIGPSFLRYLCIELFTERSERVPKDIRDGLADFMWDEKFELEYETDELTFIRLLVWQNVGYGRDAKLGIFVAKVDHLGTGAPLLVRFAVTDVDELSCGVVSYSGTGIGIYLILPSHANLVTCTLECQ